MAIIKSNLNKPSLHPRNKHNGNYNFNELIISVPELKEYVKINEFGTETIDFFNPKAVRLLNKALLKFHYGVEYWELPGNYLTPPIPGRADYLHYLSDLIGCEKQNIKVLDIGTGANLIYPILGLKEYGWTFVASEFDEKAIENAKKIIRNNSGFADKIEIRCQTNTNSMFKNIIKEGEKFDISICNPPFHSSSDEAKTVAIRKISNLKNKKINNPILNFSGKSNELWYKGGEETFIRMMIDESKDFAKSVKWFTSLVSKESLLKNIYKRLQKVEACEVKTVLMNHGNKQSRFVVWRFE